MIEGLFIAAIWISALMSAAAIGGAITWVLYRVYGDRLINFFLRDE